MKRFFFSAIALMTLATACTESGLIDKPSFYGNEISFDPYIGKAPLTRAESVDEAYLQRAIADNGGVQVYGFLQETSTSSSVETSSPYMSAALRYDVPDSDKPEVKAWMYDDIAFWPEDRALAFAAYSLNANSCITNHSDDVTKFDFTVADLVENQVDLLAIPFLTNQQDGENKVVNLQFKHLLSRIGFTVLASHPSDDVNIAIQSIVLRGVFPKTGHVDLTSLTGMIAPYYDGAVATEYDFFKDEDTDSAAGFMINSSTCVADAANNKQGEPIYPNVNMDLSLDPKDPEKWGDMYKTRFTQTDANAKQAANDAALESRYMMIMPGTVDAVIEVQYHLTADKPRFAKVNLTNWEFKPGYAYEFVLKVSTQTVEFEATFGGWGDVIEDTKPLS